MSERLQINYQDVSLSEELLNSFAKALVPEIRKFYSSEKGQAYYKKWLDKHPEYVAEKPDASASGF